MSIKSLKHPTPPQSGPISGQASKVASSVPISEIEPANLPQQDHEPREINKINRAPMRTTDPDVINTPDAALSHSRLK
ncbi:MAG: hypothetical protein ACKVQJ_06540 [Pyrinomonadaceae bacterium]